VISGLAEILKPQKGEQALPIAGKIITALLENGFTDGDLRNGLAELKIDIAEGRRIVSPGAIFRLKCADARQKRRARNANPYADHGVSRYV
jgi:hypothetical protein